VGELLPIPIPENFCLREEYLEERLCEVDDLDELEEVRFVKTIWWNGCVYGVWVGDDSRWEKRYVRRKGSGRAGH